MPSLDARSAILLVSAVLGNAACAGMLGYETLEDTATPPSPGRDAAPPKVDDGGTVEAEPPRSTRYADVVMQDQPTAYYRFEAAAPSRDHAGGVDLEIVGPYKVVVGALARDDSTQLDLVGPFGGAYVDFQKVRLDRAKSHTIELWLSLRGSTEIPATWLLVGRREEGGPRVLGVEGNVLVGGSAIPNGTPRLVLTGRTGAAGADVTIEAPFTGTPPASVHVVYVSSGDQAAIWLDGKEYGRQKVAIGTGSPGELRAIGAALQPQLLSLIPNWAGTLDELAFYPRALEPARISEHYEVGAGKK